MRDTRPTCPDAKIFNVKQTCLELEVSPKTQRNFRISGSLVAINPKSKMPKFTGAALKQCWDIEITK